jgi:hypothetical protein
MVICTELVLSQLCVAGWAHGEAQGPRQGCEGAQGIHHQGRGHRAIPPAREAEEVGYSFINVNVL